MSKFFLSLFVIVILAVFGVAGYYAYDYVSNKNSLQFEPIDIIPDSSQSDSTATSSDLVVRSNIDKTGWKVWKSDELGFEVKYPSNLVFNRGGASVILAFPKDVYFHWPLLDDSKITIVAGPTCASSGVGADNASSSLLTIDDRVFRLRKSTGVGAGNVYHENIYDLEEGSICYSLIFYNHGANGASLYVDDINLVQKYNLQHESDLKAVEEVIYGVLSSFKILSVPEGMREDAFSR